MPLSQLDPAGRPPDRFRVDLPEPDAETLARAWLEAAASTEVDQSIRRIYDAVAAEVESRGPACWASGRCCDFGKTEHLLYTTGLEAAWCVRNARTPTGDEVRRAARAGECPFQIGNACGVHAARPLGCRVYFCDRSAQAWQEALSERMLGEVRALHERFGIAYRYAEWRGLLLAVSSV